jgi:hypothetical protein
MGDAPTRAGKIQNAICGNSRHNGKFGPLST